MFFSFLLTLTVGHSISKTNSVRNDMELPQIILLPILTHQKPTPHPNYVLEEK
jgi:hypothetical protein